MLRSKAFEGFVSSFRKDGAALFEEVHGFGVAEDNDLSTIDHSAITAALQRASEPLPAQNALDIAGLSAHDTAIGCGLR